MQLDRVNSAIRVATIDNVSGVMVMAGSSTALGWPLPLFDASEPYLYEF
jgi:hypothetical protein